MIGSRGLLAECAASLVLLTVTGVLLGADLVSATRTSRGAIAHAVARSQPARLDAVLVDACGRVEQPLWMAEPAVSTTPAGIAIGHVDGRRDARLLIEWDETSVTVSVAGEVHAFGGITLADVTVRRGNVPHLRADVVSVETGQRRRLTAPLAGVPLP